MEKFITSVKKKYRERLLWREEQWPPMRGKKLVNLQLIEADKTEGFRGGDSKAKGIPIAYTNLFKATDSRKPLKKIIVEGGGGMGKTTLCTEFAEKWAEGEIFTEFNSVLLLPFREDTVSSAKTLLDLFKLFHSSEKIRSSVIDELEEREGEGVLIIADGWDELEEVKRAKGSFLYNLLFGDVLPFASLLLTSRPSASAPLHSLPSVDRLVEVVGFSEENVWQYVQSEFDTCPEKASSLLKQLDQNPLLRNVCLVPLNCAITCNLWHTLKQVLPSTLTGLYSQIILNVVLRDIKKKYPDSPINLENFDSISDYLQSSFWLTCKFAFESLSRDQIVFSREEIASLFPKGLDSSESFLCFGLLQSARSLLPVGHGVSLHFIHLTFQEFLAALHLSTLPSELQVNICKSHARNDRFSNVWKFLFGLASKNLDSTNTKVSKKVLQLDENTVDQLLSALYTKSDNLLLCNCALESKNDSVSVKVQNLVSGWLSPLTSKNVSDLVGKASEPASYSTLSQLSLFSKWKEENNSSVGNSILTSLLRASCKSLSSLPLSNEPLGISGMQTLEKAIKEDVLIELEHILLCNTLTSDIFINGALLASFTNSVALHCPRLKKLDLSRNRLGLPGACSVGEALHPLAYNKKSVDVWCNDTKLDSEAVVAMADSVVNSRSSQLPLKTSGNQTIESLSSSSEHHGKCTLLLSNNPLGYDGTLAIFRILRSGACHISGLYLDSTQLSTLSSTNKPDDRSNQHATYSLLLHLGATVQNRTVEYLSLCDNDFSTNSVHVLVEFIRICQSLRYLFCQECQLTSHKLIDLLFLLKLSGRGPRNLRLIDFSFNSIDNEGVIYLISLLPDLFPSLEKVNLFGNSVSDKVTKKLKECLESNSKRTSVLSDLAEDEKAKITDEREAKLAKERSEREARRCSVLTEWERTCSPPQSKESLFEFLRMWDELLWDLCYYAHVIVRYPGLYGNLIVHRRSLTNTTKSVEYLIPSSSECDVTTYQSTQNVPAQHYPTSLPVQPTGPSPSPKPDGLTSTDEYVSTRPGGLTSTGPGALGSTRPGGLTSTGPGALGSTRPGGLTSTGPGALGSTRPGGLTSTGPGALGSTRPGGLTSTGPGALGSTRPGGLTSTGPGALGSTRCAIESSHSLEKSVPELSLRVLTVELTDLTKPIEFGIHLNIPQSTLEIIEQDHHLDTNGQKIALFKFIANNNESLGITWSSVADALLDIHAGNLSLSIREKYGSAVHGGSN